MRRMPCVLCGLLMLVMSQVGFAQDKVDLKQTEAVAVYEELAEILNSGVWTATVKEREKVGDEWVSTDKAIKLVTKYRSLGDGKYLQMHRTANGEERDSASIFGVDYKTNEVCWWTFGQRGNSIGVIKKLGNNKWVMRTDITTDEGETGVFTVTLTWEKGKMLEEWAREIDGAAEEKVGEPITWTVKR